MTIRTHPANDAYRDGWERIFKPKTCEMCTRFEPGRRISEHKVCLPICLQYLHRPVYETTPACDKYEAKP